MAGNVTLMAVEKFLLPYRLASKRHAINWKDEKVYLRDEGRELTFAEIRRIVFRRMSKAKKV